MSQGPSDGEQLKPKPERRRHLRVHITVIRARFDDGPRTFFGYANNISKGGLGISTINPKEPSSQYLLEFSLPTSLGLTVRCNCEIVWSRPYAKGSPYEPGMGLRFLKLPEQTAAAIDLWVREENRGNPPRSLRSQRLPES